MLHHKHLLWAIFIAVLAGVWCGWHYGHTMEAVQWLGDLFLNLLTMTIIPLIVAAVISGITALGDVRKLGRFGGLTLLYYLSTTAIAVLIGLLIVNIIQPGSGVGELSKVVPEHVAGQGSTGIAEIIGSLVKPNLVAAAANNQLLPIILFCLAFGAALTTIGDRGKSISGFFDGLNEVMMKLVIWIMMLSPVGIFALIAAKLGATGGGAAFWQELSSVGLYIVTVAVGLVIHASVLFVILMTLSRKGVSYLLELLRALMTAFGTASSAATLPLTMECAIEGGVDRRAVKFVLPLGATVNMDGTALYEAVAVMFIAQAYGIHMDMTQQAIIFLTATFAAIGAAAIPSAGLVTMIIVLTAVGLPKEGIGLILAIDWFLDRLRTTVNVWGDCVGAAVLERFLPEDTVISNKS